MPIERPLFIEKVGRRMVRIEKNDTYWSLARRTLREKGLSKPTKPQLKQEVARLQRSIGCNDRKLPLGKFIPTDRDQSNAAKADALRKHQLLRGTKIKQSTRILYDTKKTVKELIAEFIDNGEENSANIPQINDPLVHPFKYDPKGRISSGFGDRKLGGKDEYHEGIDIVYPKRAEIKGTTVKVTVDSLVVFAGRSPTGGNMVILVSENAGKRIYHYDCHMESLNGLYKGQVLHKGDLLGKVGRTGKKVTGYHLHFGIYTERANMTARSDPKYRFEPVDPLNTANALLMIPQKGSSELLLARENDAKKTFISRPLTEAERKAQSTENITSENIDTKAFRHFS